MPYLNDGFLKWGGTPSHHPFFFHGVFRDQSRHFWVISPIFGNPHFFPCQRGGFPQLSPWIFSGEVEVPRSRNWCEGDLAAWANGIAMEFHREILGFVDLMGFEEIDFLGPLHGF